MVLEKKNSKNSFLMGHLLASLHKKRMKYCRTRSQDEIFLPTNSLWKGSFDGLASPLLYWDLLGGHFLSVGRWVTQEGNDTVLNL